MIVLVTGGSRGIGAATVRRLSGEGHRVWSASRSGSVAEDLPSVTAVSADVNDPEALSRLVERIVSQDGGLDAVVVNAGNGICGALEEMSPGEVQYQFQTCYQGALNTINACVPVFRKQGHGRIIAITSFAALVPLAYQGAYCAAKAALQMSMEAYTIELAPFGIQCCCILPGDIATDFTSARKTALRAGAADSPYRERFQRSRARFEKSERGGMSPARIASAVSRQLRRSKMKLRVVPGLFYGTAAFVVSFMPRSLVLRVMSRMYKR
ncbi:MAG: SDR family NAD(P)-dependent oxidoreductase [Bacteroidales bacterium]|nr:SDR family NAD(P)-dependent oxidoreductase [Bacteroidales bacterium]